jgi:hypothetical protein
VRIEISVPGIRKDRGKLPAPTILGPLTLARSPAAELPIRGQLIDAAPQELAIGAESREPVAAAHPVSSKTAERMMVVRLINGIVVLTKCDRYDNLKG